MPEFKGKDPEFLMLFDFVKHVRNYMVTIAATGQIPVSKLESPTKAMVPNKPQPGQCDLCNDRLKAGDLVNPTSEYMKTCRILIGDKWVTSPHFSIRIKEVEHKRCTVLEGQHQKHSGSTHVCLATLETGVFINVNWLKKEK